MGRTARRSKWGAALVAASLLLAACGGDAALVDTVTAQSTDTRETAAPSSQVTATASTSAGPTLICQDPPPTEIGLGTPVGFETTDADPTRCFWVEVPEGLTSISFQVGGLASDLDLSVGYGFVYTLQYNVGEFWSSREGGNTDESITIEDPAAGLYFMKVGPAGLGATSGFVLNATGTPDITAPPTGASISETTSCAAAASELTLGSPVDDEVVARDGSPEPRRYFCLQLPTDAASLTIEVAGLADNLDLFVRLAGQSDLWTDRIRGGEVRSLTIEDAAPGVYYIDVVGAYQGAGSPFTVVARTG